MLTFITRGFRAIVSPAGHCNLLAAAEHAALPAIRRTAVRPPTPAPDTIAAALRHRRP